MISFEPPGYVTVRVGKVELGQGILTALAQIAADELGVGIDRIITEPASTSTSPDEGVTAGSLSIMESGAALRRACASLRSSGGSSAAVVGTSQPRLDLPDKIMGRPRFIHDLELPGQMYGRVIRPPAVGARLSRVVDDGGVSGVVVVRDGDFLGVVASREEDAVRAADDLAALAHWDSHPLPPVSWPAPSSGTRYTRQFLAHASIAPSCGIAVWDGDDLSVWSHSQGIFRLRDAVAAALGMSAARIVVRHVEGAGCYGHNGADDAAFDAVLLARAVPGRPVQVVWSRADELSWSPLGPAMAADVSAEVAGDGRVVSWQHDVWSPGHLARPGYAGSPGLLASAHINGGRPLPPAVDPSPPAGGSTRNADPYYDFPDCRVTAHRVEVPWRTSALRSLGAHLNVYAIECHLDELALGVGRDPVEYRLAHLRDPRAREVIVRATSAAGWDAWQPRDSSGHGIAFARYKNNGAYCAVVAEVEAVHRVVVRRLVIAVDVGQAINPDGVRNQIEGGAVQATSWTLVEQVRFSDRRVTSTGWESYPILRFPDAPAVHVELLDRPDQPPLGAGEAAQGPTTAAIGNAVRNALGVPIRDLPLTPERITSTLLS